MMVIFNPVETIIIISLIIFFVFLFELWSCIDLSKQHREGKLK
jgi:hypothetical protein